MNQKNEDIQKDDGTKTRVMIHHSYKLTTQSQSKNKIYFSRLRGYRDRK